MSTLCYTTKLKHYLWYFNERRSFFFGYWRCYQKLQQQKWYIWYYYCLLGTKLYIQYLSPGYMKLLSGFKSTLVEKLEYCDFTDHLRKKFSCATIVKKSGLFQTEIDKTCKRKHISHTPTVIVFCQPKQLRKIIKMYIIQNIWHESHKKI